ncbi:unconventional myosin-XIX isoform X2 [Megalopta genalis]|uniref:unconventional myosin-XIX isoform X2 n=1 Tax=Megalopta genalis TaxID=115081 RepID=UPI003FD18678
MATTKTVSPIEWDLLNDLSAVPEDTIIDFLLERLQHGQIYTWVGPLLLALNPNNEVSTSHLYNISEFDKHVDMSKKMFESNPHIFTVAAKAHYNLIQEFGKDRQVIVISGETETGKTFNGTKCLEFFCRINKHSTCDQDHTQNIMLRIMDACRLISAFTTASTERNEVSSRHGQLIRLHYKADAISGATINSFLLERSRVTRGSHNFQIFYQMIFGLSRIELQRLHLSKYRNYDILNIDYSKKTDFHEGFQDTLKALDVLGFRDDQKNHIHEILALLIHMGNIKFREIDEACTINLDDEESKEALERTCQLSSLTEDVVTELLTTILINPRSTWRKHTSYHRCLVTAGACRMRLHSIIRHLYHLLFYWILNRANDALSVKYECSRWLGILDIFGFESFNKNGMEQLCVNYANEKMQQHFMETYLESRKYLQKEGFVESNEPSDIINIYQERLTVLEEILFTTLNDASQSFVATNVSTITQLIYKKMRGVQNKFLTIRRDDFVVQHYSCSVAYSIEDLLSKNTDKVPDEISMAFHTSENAFLRSLFKIEKDQELQIVNSSTNKKTMLTKLKHSIDTLLKELKECDLHYVKCIKPSRLNDHAWDKEDFRKQLAYIGIFDALSLANCKYPIRLHYKDFYQRYSKQPEEVVDVGKCKMILEAVEPEQRLHTLVHYGRQFIFLTEPIFFKLETNRRNYLINCANKIQEFWIRHRRNRISVNPETTNQFGVETELKKSSSSEDDDDDDVFISSPVFLNHNIVETKEKPIEDFIGNNILLNSNITEINVERINLNTTQKLVNVCSKKENIVLKRKVNVPEVLHDPKNIQEKNVSKYQFMKIIKNTVKKLIRAVIPKKLQRFTRGEGYKKETRFSDNNNNLMREYFENKMSGKNVSRIQIGNCTLFLGNRILSRRKLCETPIRIHIRPMRSNNLYSLHLIQQTELSRGLQDCI